MSDMATHAPGEVQADDMSERADVYRMYAADGTLLYVGCSVQWPVRLAAHEGEKPWWPDVAMVKIEHFPDITSALHAEGEAQEREHPVHNFIRNGRWPNMRAYRRQQNAALARREAAHAADLLARGVYEFWVHCTNCSLNRRCEWPRGIAALEQDCPRCGCSPLHEANKSCCRACAPTKPPA